MPSGGYVPGNYFTRRAMDSTAPSGHEPETSFRYQDPRGEESYVPNYLKRKWNPTDLLPDLLSEPLARQRERNTMAGNRLTSGLDQQTKYDLNLAPAYRPDPITGDPTQDYARMGGSKTPWTQRQLNKWELPLGQGGAGDFVRSEVEEEALGGPLGHMASIAGKPLLAAGKGLLGKAGVGAAVNPPNQWLQARALRLGDIFNRRFQIDTPELEKLLKHTELAGPDEFLRKFTDTTTDPGAQAKLQEIIDLSDLSAPEEDITDEIARQMALFTNQGSHAGALAPPRRGSFPGLAATEAPTPRGTSGLKTEDVAGGPIIDYGRSGLRGIIEKRMGEGPGGRRILEKGSPLGRLGDNSLTGGASGRSESQMESAQTKIMELLHGTTPVAHEIEGGGTAQLFLPHTYEPFPYRIPNHLRTPEIANQLAAEQARDVFGAITDRHTGQFMLDPAAGDVVGVDKGFGALDSYGFQGRLMPPEAVYSSMDPYGAIAKTGDLSGMVDPDTYQRMAALGLSIPEPEWRRVLEPLMDANGMRTPSRRDAAMRNFMQSIQGMPQHLDKYYRKYVKP